MPVVLVGGGGDRRVPLVMGRDVIGRVTPDGTIEYEGGVDVEAQEAMRGGLVNKMMIDGKLHSVVIPLTRRNRLRR